MCRVLQVLVDGALAAVLVTGCSTSGRFLPTPTTTRVPSLGAPAAG